MRSLCPRSAPSSADQRFSNPEEKLAKPLTFHPNMHGCAVVLQSLCPEDFQRSVGTRIGDLGPFQRGCIQSCDRFGYMASSFPRRTLENALRVPEALKEKNGGNSWPPAQVADALGVGAKSGNFFYVAGASRDYGLTEGSRDTAEITLTDLGRRAVYPGSSDEERQAKLDAFLSVEAFRAVLNHFSRQ